MLEKTCIQDKQNILTKKSAINYYQLFNKTNSESLRFESAKYKLQLVTKSSYLACKAGGGYDIKYLRVFKN